jgi:enoyl-CoA hydratase
LCVDAEELQDRALAVARQLAGGAQSAIRWTKHTLNHWYRVMAPAFDASLAYEFYGLSGPDAAEGLAAHREKRAPRFSGPTSE